jgi:outer membrane lipoprotein-sorting protein
MSFKPYVCALAVVFLSLTAAAQELSVEQIIAKNIEAKGGLEKIKAQETLRASGRMTLSPGVEAPVVMEQKRPGSFRLELTLQGQTAVQAYDGQTGWQVNPFEGQKEPALLGPDELKAAQEQADLDGPLVDYKEKGHQIELVGREQVAGRDAYKLKVTLKSGDVRYLYLDAGTFLEFKQEGKRVRRGAEQETETVYGDYKAEGGVLMPHSYEAGVKGSAQKQKVLIDKVEVNPPLDDARFKLPPGASKPDAGKTSAPADSSANAPKPADKKPETKPPGSR